MAHGEYFEDPTKNYDFCLKMGVLYSEVSSNELILLAKEGPNARLRCLADREFVWAISVVAPLKHISTCTVNDYRKFKTEC